MFVSQLIAAVPGATTMRVRWMRARRRFDPAPKRTICGFLYEPIHVVQLRAYCKHIKRGPRVAERELEFREAWQSAAGEPV